MTTQGITKYRVAAILVWPLAFIIGMAIGLSYYLTIALAILTLLSFALAAVSPIVDIILKVIDSKPRIKYGAILSFALLFVALVGSSVSNQSLSKITSQSDNLATEDSDTNFIYKNSTDQFYHVIYIEKNKQSKYYDRLVNFTFSDYQQKAYQQVFQILKEKSPVEKHKLFDLPTEWLPLHKYKDHYYLYAPADWGSTGRRAISDSTLITWYMDGPSPELLLNVTKINANQFVIKSRNPLNQDNQLIIHVLDPTTKLAVWEYPNEKEPYQLYIPKNNARQFDLIVNYCDNIKQREFEFGQIDYEELINSR